MTRSDARRNAFLLVFALYANDDLETDDIQVLEDGLCIEPDDFCRKLVNLTKDNLAEIDAAVSKHLQGWTVERLPKASLAVLRLSAAQLLYCDDIPVGVIINEAVELTKQFGNADDYAFVNGALGSLARSLPAERNSK
ncbi:MAG: transcription antitermination factor NusB [Oscillospiraceae bacterium]|nr:transcription antitermination factor NusB [Oscillospiraceae bacterium]